ncbi:hypothetical protein [Acinetobacter junii]|uniref:hypothetical protein n=1 Tax=Acinetobacter junii TaxID=40215 RepID=UPI00244841F6|nr:hypothetical protein [Acinetobacter junii]MDH0718091.1 hypothetical protein [Acinetobacter junii]
MNLQFNVLVVFCLVLAIHLMSMSLFIPIRTAENIPDIQKKIIHNQIFFVAEGIEQKFAEQLALHLIKLSS